MAPRNPRARSRDMVISMAVIMVPLLVIMWFFTSDPGEDVERVDVAPVLAKAQEESPYPLLVAEGLDEGWIPLRVAWAKDGQPWITSQPADGNSWQVGYLSPEQVYFGVQQRDDAVRAAVDTITRKGSVIGDEVQLIGRAWERYESQDGRTRSLVNIDGEVASIVTADAGFPELEAFASTLVEVAPKAG